MGLSNLMRIVDNLPSFLCELRLTFRENYFVPNLNDPLDALFFLQLTVLKDAEELLDILPKKCLPKDYGGDQPSYAELNGKHQRKTKIKIARLIRIR